MSALNFLEIDASKSASKLVMALLMTCFLSACGAGGGSGSSDEVAESQNTEESDSETEITTPIQIDPAQITSNPQNLTVSVGDLATFTVSAAGDELSFQWRKNQQALDGAITNSFSLTSVTSAEAGLYDVVVSNSEGSVTSLAALLTVNMPEQAPIISPVVITSQPQALIVDESDSASFSVSVSGGGDLTYQWLRNGAVIEGATASEFTIASANQSDIASYSVMVTNATGPVVSDTANLSVTPVQVISSIELTWDIPLEREDGSDLSLGEINGYVIAYGTDENDLSNQISVDGASMTSTTLDDLSSGTYFFSIATVDSDGIQGAYSNIIQQSI